MLCAEKLAMKSLATQYRCYTENKVSLSTRVLLCKSPHIYIIITGSHTLKANKQDVEKNGQLWCHFLPGNSNMSPLAIRHLELPKNDKTQVEINLLKGS